MFEQNKGVQNKDKDASEQRNVYSFNSVAAVGTVLSIPLGVVGSSQTIICGQIASTGLSGSPTGSLQISRFIVGTGSTLITPMSASILTIVTYGTSGAQALPASIGSCYGLLSGDELIWLTATANTAASYSINIVTQQLQAVRTDYGV
jgi:hypothetical protein